MKSILIVDDELGTRQSLKMILQDNYLIFSAEKASRALRILEEQSIHLIIMDIFMEEMDGLQLLKLIRQKYPHIEVIMVTAAKSLKTAAEAMRTGAADYIVKPFTVEEIRLVVERVLKLHKLTGELEFLRTEDKLEYNYQEIVGENPAFKSILKQINKTAPMKTPVLISGETGTGKELIARAIHFHSPRLHLPFIAIHCTSLPETLLESELFGYEKGAFTGAYKPKPGFFELADGGSLFLDEIGEMSLLTQSKILRVLQESEFIRVGGTKTVRVDVRLISATNKDLKEMIRQGTFREDLYYRLNVIHFHIPPLRERKEDIPILASHFFHKYKKEMNLPVEKISPRALKKMQDYSWPGNVREIRNVLERVLVLHGKEDIILAEHLPPDLNETTLSCSQPIEIILGKFSLEEAVSNFEKELINEALQKTDGIQTRAAQLLKTTRRILKYRMDKLEIHSQRSKADKK